MRTFLSTLHVVLAIFLIGPLASAANQSGRALREGNLGVLRLLSRLVTAGGWASLAVALFGLSLVRGRYGNEFTDAWLLVSILLYLIATALVIAVLVPLLRGAAATAAGGGSTAHLAGRAAAVAGVSSLCYVVIAILMVWQPGN